MPAATISEKVYSSVLSFSKFQIIILFLSGSTSQYSRTPAARYLTSPIYELQLIGTENNDNYIDEVMAIAEEYSVEFYDFNLAREGFLPIRRGDYFMDTNHLNRVGADMYAKEPPIPAHLHDILPQ